MAILQEKQHSVKNHFFSIILIGLLTTATYIDVSAQLLSNPELIPYRKGAKWGYCNEKKEIIIPCEYDSVAEYFFRNRAYVMRGGKFGYIDPTGKKITPFIYSSASSFNDYQTIAMVTENGKSFWIDLQGKRYDEQVLMTCADSKAYACDLEGGVIRIGNKFGFIRRGYKKVDSITNKQVQVVDTLIKPVYQNLIKSNVGVLLARLNGKWGAININNDIVIPFEWDSISQANIDLRYSTFKGVIAQKAGLYGLIDIGGNILVTAKYEKMIFPYIYKGEINSTSSAGLIHVQTQNGKWGYINQHGVEYFEQ